MSQSTIKAILAELPGYDCGVCGYPECKALARRIAMKKGLYQFCPYLGTPQQETMRQLEGKIKPVMQSNIVPKQTQIQPCVVDGKVTLEIQIPPPMGSPFPVFDITEMCKNLKAISVMEKIRCANELGYSIATWDERIIHAYTTGKIVIRRIDSEEDGIRVLKILTRGIWPSVVSQCGTVTADALTGVCLICENLICGGLQWSGIDGETNITTDHVRRAFQQIMRHDQDKYIVDAWKTADAIFQKLTYCRDELRDEIPILQTQLLQLAKTISYTLISTGDKIQMIGALGLHGIRRIFERVLTGLMEAKWGEEPQLLFRARDIFEEAYMAFRDKNHQLLGDIQKEFQGFRQAWENSKKSPETYKIAYGGMAFTMIPF